MKENSTPSPTVSPTAQVRNFEFVFESAYLLLYLSILSRLSAHVRSFKGAELQSNKAPTKQNSTPSPTGSPTVQVR